MINNIEDFINEICDKLDFVKISTFQDEHYDISTIDFNHFIPIYQVFNDQFQLQGSSVVVDGTFKEFKEKFLYQIGNKESLDNMKQHYKKYFIELYYKYENENERKNI